MADSSTTSASSPSPGGHWRESSTDDGLVLESWGQGLFVGSLVVMVCLTLAAMRRRVILHKLILAEQVLAIPHGTFCFMSFPSYGWYISWTATLLFISYILHNFVAWLKVKPFFIGGSPSFFSHRTGMSVHRVYLGSLAATVPVWIFNTYNNFQWNINTSNLYRQARPYEFLVRDPWWIFTNLILLHVISKSYGLNILQLVRKSPRLGILLVAIVFAIVFTILDVVATILEGQLSSVDGINPWWKLSLVFKCLTDAIVLDDFATELKRIAGDVSFPLQSREAGVADRPSHQGGHQVHPSSQPVERSVKWDKMTLASDYPGRLEIEDIGRTAPQPS